MSARTLVRLPEVATRWVRTLQLIQDQSSKITCWSLISDPLFLAFFLVDFQGDAYCLHPTQPNQVEPGITQNRVVLVVNWQYVDKRMWNCRGKSTPSAGKDSLLQSCPRERQGNLAHVGCLCLGTQHGDNHPAPNVKGQHDGQPPQLSPEEYSSYSAWLEAFFCHLTEIVRASGDKVSFL